MSKNSCLFLSLVTCLSFTVGSASAADGNSSKTSADSSGTKRTSSSSSRKYVPKASQVNPAAKKRSRSTKYRYSGRGNNVSTEGSRSKTGRGNSVSTEEDRRRAKRRTNSSDAVMTQYDRSGRKRPKRGRGRGTNVITEDERNAQNEIKFVQILNRLKVLEARVNRLEAAKNRTSR